MFWKRVDDLIEDQISITNDIKNFTNNMRPIVLEDDDFLHFRLIIILPLLMKFHQNVTCLLLHIHLLHVHLRRKQPKKKLDGSGNGSIVGDKDVESNSKTVIE